MKSITVFAISIILFMFFSSTTHSQQMWNTGLTLKEFSVEYIKPTFQKT